MNQPADWHPDPSGKHELRYWDGSKWTDHVADNGVGSQEPIGPPVAVSWQEKIRIAAAQAANQATVAANQAAAAIDEQSTKFKEERAKQGSAAQAPDGPGTTPAGPPPAGSSGPPAGPPPSAPPVATSAHQASDQAPSEPEVDTVADQLERLAELRDRGVLSDEEFAEQKAKILNG